MAAIPRYRQHSGTALFSAGFRPFFLGASIWASVAIPLWLGAYAAGFVAPTLLTPVDWHVHEMVFGFAAAVVAGFLLTAVPNWTGRMPLQGKALAGLIALWAAGRLAVFCSGVIGAPIATVADLSFPLVFLGVIAREVVAGKNWRNLPMLVALGALLAGNLLVHLSALGLTETAALGNRIGLITLFLLISLMGGRLIPSFTHNWLAKTRPGAVLPAAESRADHAVIIITALALISWAAAPESQVTAVAALIAGAASAWRLSRWRGARTISEPLLVILHVGYGWLAFGLLLMGADGFFGFLPPTAAWHALTVGAVGTMTLAVMTRATLGHTGRPLTAGPGTRLIYVLISAAALLRVASPLAGSRTLPALELSGAAWCLAFGLFAILYGRALVRPRAVGAEARPI